MDPKNAVKQYQDIFAQTSTINADPHRLIQILMENALEKLILAKGYMLRNEIAEKGRNISLALAIIEALQTSLDKENGADIAENLYELYAYMMTTLISANLENNPDKIQEIIKILSIIKEGWDNAPAQLKAQAS